MILLAVLAGFALYFLKDFAESLGGARPDPAPGRRLDAAGRGDHAGARPAPAPRGRLRCGARSRRRRAGPGGLHSSPPRSLLTSAARTPRAQEAPATLIADAGRPTTARPGCSTPRATSRCSTRAGCCAPRGIIYDEARRRDPRRGAAGADRPGGRRDACRRRGADARISTEGLIDGARLLIAGQLQLAAAEVRRTGGRYTTLYRTIASSCTICAENPTPTWAIRAARVTQDAVARRIYFEDARVELFGVAGRLSAAAQHPRARGGAGQRRARARASCSSDIYGFGFKLPYYRVLGPSADATLTPFVTTTGAALIEGEYRRRFANGGFDFCGRHRARRRPR